MCLKCDEASSVTYYMSERGLIIINAVGFVYPGTWAQTLPRMQINADKNTQSHMHTPQSPVLTQWEHDRSQHAFNTVVWGHGISQQESFGDAIQFNILEKMTVILNSLQGLRIKLLKFHLGAVLIDQAPKQAGILKPRQTLISLRLLSYIFTLQSSSLCGVVSSPSPLLFYFSCGYPQLSTTFTFSHFPPHHLWLSSPRPF